MPITFKKTVAVFKGNCGIAEVEPLLTWLEAEKGREVNLKNCSHLHGSLLQVLMYSRPRITIPPVDGEVARWLVPAVSRSA